MSGSTGSMVANSGGFRGVLGFQGFSLKPPFYLIIVQWQISWSSMESPFWLALVLRDIDFVLHGAKVLRDLLWLTLALFSIGNRSIDQHTHSFWARKRALVGVVERKVGMV